MNLFQASGAQLKETTTNEMGRLSLESQKNSEKVVHLSLQDETVPSHTLETGANRAVRKRSTPRKTQNKEYKSRANNNPKEDLLHSVTNSTLVEEVTQIPSEDAIREPEAEDLKRIEQEFCLEKLFSKGRSKENWKRHSSLSGLCDEKDNRRNGVDRKERNEKTEKEEEVGDMLANGSKDMKNSEASSDHRWKSFKNLKKSKSLFNSTASFISNCHVVPKLSFEEEVEICNQIQLLRAWERERDRVSELVGRSPTLAEWAEAVGFSNCFEFARKIRSLRESKDRIIHSNLRLVYYVARFYSKYGLSLQDLMQEGSIGLIKAAERFDSSKGFRFGSYAIWWIKYAMTRALTEQTRHWRIPAYFYEFMSTVRRTDSKLTAELGREPTQEEVFRESGLTMEQFQTANRCLLNSLSLDSPLSYESGDRRTTLGDTVAGDVIHPEDELENNMLRRDLEKILEATLTPRERDVIRMRFGLDDGACKTLDEISSIFCVTRERIRHLELSALRKLRHPYRCILLKDYVSVKNKGLADFFSRSLSGEEEGFLDK
ncbi:hypothetical protein GAYE_SCF07G2944 [Galdieria yellowstonensis]|uniref:RNA polymerase sigma-70 domain-containing protein n=1 Tax=Galdieria yellowstonensis TaxID=3028027 RepID=A0AAV9IC60_9RHOD|nr:hypothetical protein GAYE_SCF07G2944 [Galdieria yellowstonensis]